MCAASGNGPTQTWIPNGETQSLEDCHVMEVRAGLNFSLLRHNSREIPEILKKEITYVTLTMEHVM